MTLSKDDELLLNAHLDGELDSLEASRFEARLASEPALAAEIEAYRLLRAALRSDLAEDAPSPDLRRRITSSLDLRTPRRTPVWGALAASFLSGAVLVDDHWRAPSRSRRRGRKRGGFGTYPQPHGASAN
jgi:anti-sigma factor RsiW